jgi:CubicO group peptidase (beta-lactamase class C family)
MKPRFLIRLALAALITSAAASAAVAQWNNEKVDALFAQWNKPNSPGCALAVIKDGQVVYKHGYGIANLDYDIPISSKPFSISHRCQSSSLRSASL